MPVVHSQLRAGYLAPASLQLCGSVSGVMLTSVVSLKLAGKVSSMNQAV